MARTRPTIIDYYGAPAANGANQNWALKVPAQEVGDLILVHLGTDAAMSHVLSDIVDFDIDRIGDLITVAQDVGDTNQRASVFGWIAKKAHPVGWISVIPTYTGAEEYTYASLSIKAGTFDASDPIGASANSYKGTASTTSSTNALTAETSDANGLILHYWTWDAISDSDAPTGWYRLRNVDIGLVGDALLKRLAAALADESVAAATISISSETESRVTYIVKGAIDPEDVAPDLPTGSSPFSVNAQDNDPQALWIDASGTRMYMSGSGVDNVNQYSLDPAWDISSASFVRSFTPTDLNTMGLWFKSDGTMFFVVSRTSDRVVKYTLSTAWDISTASNAQTVSLTGTADLPSGIWFKPDGTRMYVTDVTADRIFSWTLGTPFDLTTLSYDTVEVVADLNLWTPASNSIADLVFMDDGLAVWILSSGTEARIGRYKLSVPWALDSAYLFQDWVLDASFTYINGLHVTQDETKLFILGSSSGVNDSVWYYDMSDGPQILSMSPSAPYVVGQTGILLIGLNFGT